MSPEEFPNPWPPEEIGEFRLYAPVRGSSHRTAWTMTYYGNAIPGSYADRNACQVVMGMLMAGPVESVLGLLDRLRGECEEPVTVERLVLTLERGIE